MSVLFEREYYLRMSDFDRFGRIKPSGIMDLFQDAASAHAGILGCAFEDLIKKQMLWALVRLKFTILKQPKLLTCVKVKTWPLAPSRAGFKREYQVLSTEGELLIKGTSDWVIMHSEERKLMAVTDVYSIKEGFLEEKSYEERTGRVRDFDGGECLAKITPRFCDLDRNGHVNNIKYLDYVMNAISPQKDFAVSEVQIEFRKEILYGDSVEIICQQEESVILAKGVNPGGETYFNCKLG